MATKHTFLQLGQFILQQPVQARQQQKQHRQERVYDLMRLCCQDSKHSGHKRRPKSWRVYQGGIAVTGCPPTAGSPGCTSTYICRHTVPAQLAAGDVCATVPGIAALLGVCSLMLERHALTPQGKKSMCNSIAVTEPARRATPGRQCCPTLP